MGRVQGLGRVPGFRAWDIGMVLEGHLEEHVAVFGAAVRDRTPDDAHLGVQGLGFRV